MTVPVAADGTWARIVDAARAHPDFAGDRDDSEQLLAFVLGRLAPPERPALGDHRRWAVRRAGSGDVEECDTPTMRQHLERGGVFDVRVVSGEVVR